MPPTNQPEIIQHVAAGQMCCDPEWEAAYKRFETSEEEIAKFIARFKKFGFESLPKDARINDIFCGRGNALVALQRMGIHQSGRNRSVGNAAEGIHR